MTRRGRPKMSDGTAAAGTGLELTANGGGGGGGGGEQNPLTANGGIDDDVPAVAAAPGGSCCCCCSSSPGGRQCRCSRTVGLSLLILVLTVIMVAFFSITARPNNGIRSETLLMSNTFYVIATKLYSFYTSKGKQLKKVRNIYTELVGMIGKELRNAEGRGDPLPLFGQFRGGKKGR